MKPMPIDALKILAFLLPQYHNDRHNNLWWGEGFTEWVNVKAAKPLYEGHDQPRIPRDGYYSYEDPLELSAQFENARAHGVDGFVFYHYWSLGTRLLEKPLDFLLADESIGNKSNFALCWANHSWTRSWKNRQGAMDVLLEQEYETNREEILQHVKFLVRCFCDTRYLKIDGNPVFFIYKPEALPNLETFVSLLNQETIRMLGKPCHISGMITTWQPNWDYLDVLSSATLAQPAVSLYSPIEIFSKSHLAKFGNFRPSHFVRALPQWLKSLLYPLQDRFIDKITFFDYENCWEKLLQQLEYCLMQERVIHLSSFVDFDNTARYGSRARLFRGFSPEKFEQYFERAVAIALKNERSGLMLVNAWNEWGEGMYLQADMRHDNKRLDSIARVRQAFRDGHSL